MSHKPTHHRVYIGVPVDQLMQPDIAWVAADATLTEVESVLEGRDISSVLVREGKRPVGVVTRTDLLRVARRNAGGHHDAVAPLPSMRAGELMGLAPITISADASVSSAALHMVADRVHRLFVERGGAIVGVFSTKEVLLAIIKTRVATPVQQVMSQPLYTNPADTPLSAATDRLANARVTGLTVVDEEHWPIGYFAQREALLARNKPSDTRVEDEMNCALVCLHDRAALHRAAALANAARARRVLVIQDRTAVGVLTPLDFARAVSASS